MDFLAEQMAQILRNLMEQGFEPPLRCAVLAANSSGCLVRYDESDEGLDPTFLADHVEGKGYALPIHWMFVDRHGKAAHVEWAKGDTPPDIHVVEPSVN